MELSTASNNKMSLFEFLESTGFDIHRFAIPLQFWFDLNAKSNDEWVWITDELINIIGYKSTESNVNHSGCSLLRFIRAHVQEGSDFLTTLDSVVKKGRGGAQYKTEI